jgi:AAA domain
MAEQPEPTVEIRPNGTYLVTIPPHASIDASASLSGGKAIAMCSLRDDGKLVIGPVRVDLNDLREIERVQMVAGSQNGRVNWIGGLTALAGVLAGPDGLLSGGGDIEGGWDAPSCTPTVVTLADVEPEPVEWLWFPYLPMGKLTLLEGDPGVGKTWLALAIAAHVSQGTQWPGGAPPPQTRWMSST